MIWTLDKLKNQNMETWKEAVAECKNDAAKGINTKQVCSCWDEVALRHNYETLSDRKRLGDVIKILNEKNILLSGNTCLDVGCGRGLFATEFAKRGLSVALYDLSPEMLKYTAGQILQLGLPLPVTYQGNWQTENVESMKGKFDLVFSALNPAVTNSAAIDKMNQCSREWCMYMYSAGGLQEPLTEQLDRIILGNTVPNSGFNEVIFPFNYLYCSGYQPELSYTSSQWENSQGVEEKIAELEKRYDNYIVMEKKHKGIIRKFVESNARNGQVTSTVLWKMGILLWKIKSE